MRRLRRPRRSRTPHVLVLAYVLVFAAAFQRNVGGAGMSTQPQHGGAMARALHVSLRVRDELALPCFAHATAS